MRMGGPIGPRHDIRSSLLDIPLRVLQVEDLRAPAFPEIFVMTMLEYRGISKLFSRYGTSNSESFLLPTLDQQH
jgi:hypothetical protein